MEERGSSLRFLTDSPGSKIVGNIGNNRRSLDQTILGSGKNEVLLLLPLFLHKMKTCVLQSLNSFSHGNCGRNLESGLSLDGWAVCHLNAGYPKNIKSVPTSSFTDESAET